MEIDDLPFVGAWPAQGPRSFWAVKPTGDAIRDGDLGYDCALAFLRYEASQDHNLHPYILPWVVADMPRKLTSIEIAFLTVVGIAASHPAGVHDAERVVSYWRECLKREVEAEAERQAKRNRRRSGRAAA